MREKTRHTVRWAVIGLCCMLALLSTARVEAAGTGGYAAPYFQADFTQSISDWASPLVNPALLYRVNQKRLDFAMYRFGMADEGLGYQHVGFILPYLRNHTFGATVLFSSNSIDRTQARMDGSNVIGIDALGRSTYLDVWFIPSYSIRVAPWLVLGANAKYRYQNRFRTADQFSSALPGLDLGMYVNPLDNYRDLVGDLGFSLSFQDVLPTKTDWGDDNSDMSVTRGRAGVRWAGFNDNVVADAEVVADNALITLFKALDIKDYLNMFRAQNEQGVDTAGIDALKMVFRPGVHVKAMFIPQVWAKAGWTNNNIPYVGFNYNWLWLMPEMINYLNLDLNLGYSFVDRSGSISDQRGFTSMFKLGLDFGPTREQILSKKLYDRLILAPMDAYQEAMRLYLAGKYWEASFAFGKVLSLFPNFHLNDKVKWYMGDCYTKLYMNDIAREVFREALEEFTTSEMRSKYIYGLQRLDYREGNEDEALKNHAFIINLYPDSDIRGDADYLAGEIQFQRKNYNVAEQLLSRLKPGDPAYLYAQYTLAVINVENNKEAEAVRNLTAIVADSTAAGVDQVLQDAANLKLGHLYFESGDKLRQAVEAYVRVPDGSPYQDEALLGTAWAWMKVNRPREALQSIDKLIYGYGESSLIPEAYLVKGYALMLIERYAEAVKALEECVAAAKRDFITDEDVSTRKSAFEETEQQFSSTARKIKQNALRKPTNKTFEERPEMFREYQGFAQESRDLFSYMLEAKSHKRFFMRENEIIADASYALAKATNLQKSKTAMEKREQQLQKQQEIEEEQRKILEQMEELKKQQEEQGDK